MINRATFYTFLSGHRVHDAPAPPLLRFRSSKTFIIATIAIAVFTDIFLYSVVVPVLPFALTARAGVAPSEVQKWTSIFLAVYGAALAVGSPIFGWFADRSTSRRLPLLLGLLALGGATVMLCLGSSLAVLIMGRFLQGLSASVVWTVGLALLSDTVKKEDIGQAMGYVSAGTSAGSLCGPLLGGLVYQRAGYYAVFAMGFGLICMDIILRFGLIEKSVAMQWEDSVIALESVEDEVTPVSVSPAVPEVSEKTMKEVRTKPLTNRLPAFVKLLSRPRILVALFGCFDVSASIAALDTSLPLFVISTFRWTSLGAGLIFICLVIPALLAPLAGIVADKYGSRLITTAGLLCTVLPWTLLRLVTRDSLGQKILLCALLTLLGACETMIMAPLMADIDHAVALEEKRRPGQMGKRGAAAQGFGLFNLAYALGTLVGPLWAGFVVQSRGWGTMTWTLALLSGVCAVATFLWTGGRIMLKDKEGEGGRRREVHQVESV